MVRWTFCFEEGHIKSDAREEAEDLRLCKFMVENPTGVLYLPGDEMDVYLNMEMVKFTVRQPNLKEDEPPLDQDPSA